jgi:hypothetical protein
LEEPKIVINTSMTKGDYRNFLYIATFLRNKLVIPLLALISLAGGLIIGFDNGSFSWTRLIISWILLFALAVAVIVLKVERKNAQRVKTDKTGAFDSVSTLKFYDDRMVMENESLKSSSELKYDQFFALMESKDYFIFYLTVNQASLIRKKDVDNLEVFKVFIVDKFNSRYKKI